MLLRLHKGVKNTSVVPAMSSECSSVETRLKRACRELAEKLFPRLALPSHRQPGDVVQQGVRDPHSKQIRLTPKARPSTCYASYNTGDARATVESYLLGRRVHQRSAQWSKRSTKRNGSQDGSLRYKMAQELRSHNLFSAAWYCVRYTNQRVSTKIELGIDWPQTRIQDLLFRSLMTKAFYFHARVATVCGSTLVHLPTVQLTYSTVSHARLVLVGRADQ